MNQGICNDTRDEDDVDDDDDDDEDDDDDDDLSRGLAINPLGRPKQAGARQEQKKTEERSSRKQQKNKVWFF